MKKEAVETAIKSFLGSPPISPSKLPKTPGSRIPRLLDTDSPPESPAAGKEVVLDDTADSERADQKELSELGQAIHDEKSSASEEEDALAGHQERELGAGSPQRNSLMEKKILGMVSHSSIAYP